MVLPSLFTIVYVNSSEPLKPASGTYLKRSSVGSFGVPPSSRYTEPCAPWLYPTKLSPIPSGAIVTPSNPDTTGTAGICPAVHDEVHPDVHGGGGHAGGGHIGPQFGHFTIVGSPLGLVNGLSVSTLLS